MRIGCFYDVGLHSVDPKHAGSLGPEYAYGELRGRGTTSIKSPHT